MENFDNINLYATGWLLNQTSGILEDYTSIKHRKILSAVKRTHESVRNFCNRNNLIQSVAFLDAIVNDFSIIKTEDARKSLIGKIESFDIVLSNEIRSTIFFRLSVKEKVFFDNKYPFGEEVFDLFSSANFDIEEASKSIALGRYTASVFHCMRVIESGLDFIAIPLSIDIKKLPSWHSVIEKIEHSLNKKHSTKNEEWQRLEPEYKDILATINSIKSAWRNPTMHLANKYTEQEAEDIFNAVAHFMRNLAKNPPKP